MNGVEKLLGLNVVENAIEQRSLRSDLECFFAENEKGRRSDAHLIKTFSGGISKVHFHSNSLMQYPILDKVL